MDIDNINNHIDKDKFINDTYEKMCIGQTYRPSIMGPVHRIIVLGDIHGDYNLAISMLKISNLIEIHNNKIVWTGNDTYVVQVGDQIDRCRPIGNMLCNNPNTTLHDEASDIKILKLFTDLHIQASKKGGAVISLLGNHEIMNSLGQMNYVSYEGLKEFENYEDNNKTFKTGEQARMHAFAPGNEYGTYLGCTRYSSVIIGSNLFVHAGIIDGLINEIGIKGLKDFESIDIAIRMWLMGLLKKKYISNIIRSSTTSMFWTRLLGHIPPGVEIDNPVCMTHIKEVLKLFKIGSMIIGHTPQAFLYSDDINATCSNKIWRVDTGSSSAFDRFDTQFTAKGNVQIGRRPQILEIIDDKIFSVCDFEKCVKQSHIENNI